ELQLSLGCADQGGSGRGRHGVFEGARSWEGPNLSRGPFRSGGRRLAGFLRGQLRRLRCFGEQCWTGVAGKCFGGRRGRLGQDDLPELEWSHATDSATDPKHGR
ncbi:unnamed protein product, partial [Symbiodinium sp. CCMP2456]